MNNLYLDVQINISKKGDEKGNSILKCFGKNSSGQLGIGKNNEKQHQMVSISSFPNIFSVHCGANHSLILLENGEVYSTGSNLFGQLRLGHYENRNIFTKTNLSKILSISTGYSHSLFLNKKKELFVCGNNYYGQLGFEDKKNSNIDSQLRFEKKIKLIQNSIYFKEISQMEMKIKIENEVDLILKKENMDYLLNEDLNENINNLLNLNLLKINLNNYQIKNNKVIKLKNKNIEIFEKDKMKELFENYDEKEDNILIEIKVPNFGEIELFGEEKEKEKYYYFGNFKNGFIDLNDEKGFVCDENKTIFWKVKDFYETNSNENNGKENNFKKWKYENKIIEGFLFERDNQIIFFKENVEYKGNFEKGKRKKGVLKENGKEYFVEYDEKGIEILEKRKRTFEGIRIMIIGNEKVGKTSFKTRLIGSDNLNTNNVSFKKVLNERKEEDMTHGVGKYFLKIFFFQTTNLKK